jgi:AbrB family looped-hinge helix DNA binding protein
MTLVKVKRWSQVTLPVGVRRALDIGVGDYLDAEIVDGGVLLKPVAATARDVALDAVAVIRPDPRGKETASSEAELAPTVTDARAGRAKARWGGA